MRRWLAQKLYPEAFVDQRKFHFLLGCVDDVHKWCFGHVPAAHFTADWLLKRLRIHFMSLDEYGDAIRRHPPSITAGDISDFRERMKRDFPRGQAAA